MAEFTKAKTPIHLWLVGVLSLLWNGFGAFDYFMTRTKGAGHIRSMMPGTDADKFMEYINGFPIWASVGWGLGVWFALLGSILLLMRHRFAVTAFAVSLVGAILGIGYQLINPIGLPEMASGFEAFAPYMVIAVALGLLLYARAQQAKGVLA